VSFVVRTPTRSALQTSLTRPLCTHQPKIGCRRDAAAVHGRK
jgi:hypothetical protein